LSFDALLALSYIHNDLPDQNSIISDVMMEFREMLILVRNSYQKMADDKNTTISEFALENSQTVKRDHLKAFISVRTQRDRRLFSSLANLLVCFSSFAIPVDEAWSSLLEPGLRVTRWIERPC
jgi:hypothetical protein